MLHAQADRLAEQAARLHRRVDELEGIMEQEQVRFGQRIRVNMPGAGDHGQVGTIKKVRGGSCYVHLDWDERPQHVVLFYATDLERVPDEPLPALDWLETGNMEAV